MGSLEGSENRAASLAPAVGECRHEVLIAFSCKGGATLRHATHGGMAETAHCGEGLPAAVSAPMVLFSRRALDRSQVNGPMISFCREQTSPEARSENVHTGK